MTRSKRAKEGRMTESEELFYRFGKSQGWRVERIDEALGRKVPDFFVRLGNDAGS